MANNFKDSYYALKTVEIGVNIATIAKKYRFLEAGGQKWRSMTSDRKNRKTFLGD